MSEDLDLVRSIYANPCVACWSRVARPKGGVVTRVRLNGHIDRARLTLMTSFAFEEKIEINSAV